ncbi:MAG: zinc-ribbon domain-containing protein [Desulfuromonadales bacterium]|nr:zinc-ribbon domain-containing protein [Desulfuromonadales bacterium]
MIVQCPSCSARFRLDRERLAGKRVTLRCARCRNHFKAELPAAASGENISPQWRIMIAHSDRELCATIRTLVEGAGMLADVGHEGAQVLQAMTANPPHVALVDVALQGLYAFEVVDKVRQQPGLGDVKIILLSSVYNRMAYKRSPSSLYGADDYVEKHHLPDDLVPKINRLVGEVSAATSPGGAVPVPDQDQDLVPTSPAGPSSEFVQSVNQKIRSAEDREVGAREVPELERARRLARIIVSDIALYSQDRVDTGILHGNWSELLASEIREARNLFRERFPSDAIQNMKLLEAAFIDLFEKRRRELSAE